MATKRFARSLNSFAVLLAVFGLVGAGGSLETAAAQDSGDVVRFSLGTDPPDAFTLCVGQKKKITVFVARETAQTRRFNQIHDIKVVSDIEVRVSSDNPGVGDITRGLGGLDEDLTSFTAKFDFKANKAGTTTIHFKTLFSVYRIPGSELLRTPGPFPTQFSPENAIKVTVKKSCKAKVSSNQSWRGDGYLVTAGMDGAEMVADDQGNFTGSGTLNWTAHAVGVFGCDRSEQTDQFAPSPVDLTGQMDDTGNLIVKLNYQPAQDSVTIHCVSLVQGTHDDQFTVSETPQTLNVNVPASEGAVSVTRPQTLMGVRSSVPGEAVVDVELETEQATSALAGRQIGGLGLADRFPSWRGAHQAFSVWTR